MSTPQRIQLSRAKGWRKPENTVVVARPSKWGNWYKATTFSELWAGTMDHAMPDPKAFVVVRIDKYGNSTGQQWAGFADRAEATEFAVTLHRRSMLATAGDVDGRRHHRRYLRELAGKNLACWCPIGQPCHADVLLELANEVTA